MSKVVEGSHLDRWDMYYCILLNFHLKNLTYMKMLPSFDKRLQTLGLGTLMYSLWAGISGSVLFQSTPAMTQDPSFFSTSSIKSPLPSTHFSHFLWHGVVKIYSNQHYYWIIIMRRAVNEWNGHICTAYRRFFTNFFYWGGKFRDLHVYITITIFILPKC